MTNPELKTVDVILTIEGGILQGIMARQPLNVLVIDYDTDGGEAMHSVAPTPESPPEAANVTLQEADAFPELAVTKSEQGVLTIERFGA